MSSMGPSKSFWNGTTSALQPGAITSKETMSFMCVLSIKVPIRKMSGNLFNDPRIRYKYFSYMQCALNCIEAERYVRSEINIHTAL